MPYDSNKHEKEVLEFWKHNQIFEKTVSERPESEPYVFYDGPPFATGLPHYGHILSSVIKDVVPRYWTMKGKRVRRRWGWDCHGLPIEQLVEKDLNISGKKDIEVTFGVEKFNDECRSKVLTYSAQWKEMVDRIGRWVEFDNAYKTMDSSYMESVWWALKTMWGKGLIYEGRKVLQYCPRCETPVSKAETAMDHSYKDVTEESVTVCFKITNAKEKDVPEGTQILAWTTTPWTLPGNVALAVGEDINYSLVKVNGTHYIIAKDRLMHYFGNDEFEVIAQPFGRDLVGLTYEPLFDMPAMQNAGSMRYTVLPAGFVTTEEGTGIVHTAVMYGEDDYELAKKYDLPGVPMLNDGGMFNDVVPEFIRGMYFKKSEKLIKDNLAERGILLKREQTTHSYPHCWRCDTPLFYNAISAWFINLQTIKNRMIELNERVQWFPEHLKHGRFLNILETAPDWNISRNRYWATALPFWRCTGKDCPDVACLGSVAELKERAINFEEVFGKNYQGEIDLHKHTMDKIKLQCINCKSEMHRIPEVIDCWVEAASMPFAEFHYPFENTDVFEKRFPGQYIAEYIAQTRAWFYYMHVIGVLLFDSNAYEHVVTTGTILNEKGEKLSKSKKNYPDPWGIIEQYGVDALRYYLMTSVVMQAENLHFNEREVRDVYNKVINILWNVVTFYEMYAGEIKDAAPVESEHVLDKWIMARLSELHNEVTTAMDNYDTVRAGRPFKDFVDDLSTWYLRRSRDRFKGATGEEDKKAAIATLHDVLYILARLMAPFTPFISENIYTVLKTARPAYPWKESVHLEFWPRAAESVNTEVLEQMKRVRKIVEMGLSLRKDASIRVRQPLGRLAVEGETLNSELQLIIGDELNVKEVVNGKESGENWVTKEDMGLTISLNTEITPALQKEGLVRELVRAINDMRKEAKLTPKDEIAVAYSTDDALLNEVFVDYAAELKAQVLAREFSAGGETEVDIAGIKLKLSLIV